MRRIAKETTNFDLVPFEIDVGNVRWNAGIQATDATLVGSRVYMLGEAYEFETATEERVEGVCCIDLPNRATRWTKITPSPVLTKFFSFLVNDSLVVIDQKHIWKLDLLEQEWSLLETSSIPTCQLEDCICEYVEESGEAIFFGGQPYNRNVSTNLVFSLNTETLTWKRLQPSGSPPSAREGHSSCSVAGRKETTIYVFGGRVPRYEGRRALNDLYALSCKRRKYSWSQIKLRCRIRGLSFASISNVEGMLFVYGGYDESYADTSQLIRYDTRNGLCRDFSKRVQNAQKNSFHVALTYNDGILMFGGYRRDFSEVVLLQAADG